MVKQIIFVGNKNEVMSLIKNMIEFETLGKFFDFQNEIMQSKTTNS